ncbi:MAG: rRNA maturation RNase YbeY [Treponema sp.]|nr:rRNA maturation RNase YbeY [Treponema sp.]
MNRVELSAGGLPLPGWAEAAGDYSLRVLDKLGKDNWDLSVFFCDDRYMKTLNAQYRHRDEATDVLSFTLGETINGGGGESRFLPGDIVISLETLRENARYFETSPDEELRRLLIHGILHLNGMDHETNEAAEPMLALQEKILAELTGAILSAQAVS